MFNGFATTTKMPHCTSLTIIRFRIFVGFPSENWPSLSTFRYECDFVSLPEDLFKNHPKLSSVQLFLTPPTSGTSPHQIPFHLLCRTTVLCPTLLNTGNLLTRGTSQLTALVNCTWSSPHFNEAAQMSLFIPNMKILTLVILDGDTELDEKKEESFDFERVGSHCPLIESVELQYRGKFGPSTTRHLRRCMCAIFEHFTNLCDLRINIQPCTGRTQGFFLSTPNSNMQALSLNDMNGHLDRTQRRRQCDCQVLCRLVFLMTPILPPRFQLLVFNRIVFDRFQVECGAWKRIIHKRRGFNCSRTTFK